MTVTWCAIENAKISLQDTEDTEEIRKLWDELNLLDPSTKPVTKPAKPARAKKELVR